MAQSTNFDKLFRINDQIKAKEIRLIDEKGEMIGVTSVFEGIRRASQAGLDLVEVSPNAAPPVCKIANFGKMKYELQKKASDSKKKQKIVETKEVKMSINIGKGDYDVKIKNTAKFIENGDKVRVSIKMRGREITHADLARKMMEGIIVDTEAFAKPEAMPKLEGMQLVVTLAKKP
jgi:translation initiation factor IF-3